jgi:ribonuclease HI
VTIDLLNSRELKASTTHIVTVYIDGASKGNPGPGGWATYAPDGSVDISGHSAHATNNEMELTAAVEALKSVPLSSSILIRTDSKLIIGWLSQGWKCSTNPKIPGLIREFFRYRAEKNLDVRFEWVKGHGTDPNNGYVDAVASARCKG